MAMQAAQQQSASGNWKLDADDGGGAGLALNSHSRVLLMAKLGENAGIKVPLPTPTLIPLIGPNTTPAPPVIPPVGGIPSVSILICNMFDAATETEPHWDEDIREDVLEECSKHGQVEHIKVDTVRQGGMVFVRFNSIDAATKTANALNGRFFAGRTIISAFLERSVYDEMVR